MIIGTKVIVYLYISHVGCTNKEVWLNPAVFYNLYTYEMSSFTDFIVIQEMQPCIITPLCSYLANCMYAHRLYMPNTLPFSYTAVLLLLIKTLHVYNEHVRFCGRPSKSVLISNYNGRHNTIRNAHINDMKLHLNIMSRKRTQWVHCTTLS